MTLNINKVRSALYKSARILDDVNAAKNGTLWKQITRHASGILKIRLSKV